MANAFSGNSYFVDTSSSSGDATSFQVGRGLLVGVVFTAAANTDVITIFDLGSDNASAGIKKLSIKASTAGSTQLFRLGDNPILFTNGAWITLTGSPTATLIIRIQGSGSQ